MKMTKKHVSSASPFEKEVGFSRAVRIGNQIAISGTAPIGEDGKTACHGDMYGQTKRCIEIILKAVEEAGGSPDSVIRTRIFLTDINRWKEAALAHAEAFNQIKPASTLIEVSHLINSEWLVEMEADCIVLDS